MDLTKLLEHEALPIEDILVKIKRRYQTHEINQDRYRFGEYHHLFPILKKYPSKFKAYTRMALTTFLLILLAIEDELKKDWCNLHQPIRPEEQLVLTLRFLITGMSYPDLAMTFRMGKSTVCTIVKKVMAVIFDTLQPEYMKKPTQNDFINISNRFEERFGFPHCVGAIDCRHIGINKPAHSKSLHYNWKQFYSVKLQAVVDADFKFIFIEVGDFGSAHDSNTFTKSKLHQCLQTGQIKLPPDGKLKDSKITLPYFFIGDGAYMLQEHLMKPFRRDKKLSAEQDTFNSLLSGARSVVECAFGHLVRMWKIFRTKMEYTADTAILITKCTCLLRNIIIQEEGVNSYMFEQAKTSASSSSEDTLIGDNDNDNCQDFVVGCGKEVRDELTKYFMNC